MAAFIAAGAGFALGNVQAGLIAALAEVTPERVRAAAAALRIDTIYFLKGKEAQ